MFLPTVLLVESKALIFSISVVMVLIKNDGGSGFELVNATVIRALIFLSSGSFDADLFLFCLIEPNRSHESNIFLNLNVNEVFLT